MSTKQFISAEEHLAKLGVTVPQAQDFISANLGQPELLYTEAVNVGLTNSMLGEITNSSMDNVIEYFISNNLDPDEVDNTSMLSNSDLGSLEDLVNFNENTGILSNASLKETVQPLLIFITRYEFFLSPVHEFYQDDEIYDAEELGVSHLDIVPATDASIESLFYGSLINMFNSLDQSELNQITAFPDDGNPEDFQALLLGALSESPLPGTWSDEQLAELVVNQAVAIHDKFWSEGNNLVGVLDLSFLGLATA